jgi:hypothetical protein
MKQTRRAAAALEQDAMLRLARFERSESWQGLSPGDPVRIAGHRGGTWRFRAFVTNTSNGACWVEVSEVMAAGRRRRRPAGAPSGDEDGEPAATTMTRARSFRPELVVPLRSGRRRSEPRLPAPAPARPASPQPAPEGSAPLQRSLFDGS